jgi:hypothetical protein
LLTLLVLSTFMDRRGFAFPSQETLATASRVSLRTVQRHLHAAIQAGWLHAQLAGRTDRKWRHYCYRCCIPDHIEVDEQQESVSNAMVAESGEIGC